MKLYPLLVFLLLYQVSFSQWKQEKFMIGTFADPRISYDKNFIKDSLSYRKVINAYFNLLTGPQYYMGSRDFSMMDRTLKLAEKFNMKLLTIDSRMQIAGNVFNKDTAMKIISHFKSLNSKAFEGYYIYGEASAKHINQITYWANFFKQNDPDHIAYYYLLPRYAFNSDNEYESYVTSFASNKATDVLAYDSYPFAKNGSIINSYFYNLDLISKKAGSRPFWCYILSTPTPYYNDPTEYQLNFSAFCPIAYGTKGLIYFTYETIPEKYNLKFGNAIIDKDGNPTPKYEIVKRINQYISRIVGPVIMNSKRIGTYHLSANAGSEQLSNTQVLNSNVYISNVSDDNILIGIFKSLTSASKYLILVNKKNEELDNVLISLKGNFKNTIKIYPRMYDFNGTVAIPTKINANFDITQTKFTIPQFRPGEAILLEF